MKELSFQSSCSGLVSYVSNDIDSFDVKPKSEFINFLGNGLSHMNKIFAAWRTLTYLLETAIHEI
jgi:hypothetical protein